jgi:hypothetical protein
VASARGVERIGLQGDRAPRASASDYAFLVGRHIDRAALVRAEALGKKWGVLPHTVMIANGWVSARDYYQALAESERKSSSESRTLSPLRDHQILQVMQPRRSCPRLSISARWRLHSRQRLALASFGTPKPFKGPVGCLFLDFLWTRCLRT